MYATDEQVQELFKRGGGDKLVLVTENNLVNSHKLIFEEIEHRLAGIKAYGEEVLKNYIAVDPSEYGTYEEELAKLKHMQEIGLVDSEYNINHNMVRTMRVSCTLTIAETEHFINNDHNKIDHTQEGYKEAVLTIANHLKQDYINMNRTQEEEFLFLIKLTYEYREALAVVASVEGLTTVDELIKYYEETPWDYQLYSETLIKAMQERIAYFGW